MFKKSVLPADALMADDRIKMGGRMYRIAAEATFSRSVVLYVYDIKKPNAGLSAIAVPRKTSFKVYNLK